MRIEEELLLDVARRIVNPQELISSKGIESYAGVDWQRFLDLAISHEILPFVYLEQKRRALPVPERVAGFLRSAYYTHLLRAQVLQGEFDRIAVVAAAAGIPLAPLKGIAFLNTILRRYPSRMMSDIDVLVHRADLERSIAFLEGAGYRQELHGLKPEYWMGRHYHIVFHRAGTSSSFVVELHWGLDYPGLLDATFYDTLWNRVGLVELAGVKVPFLTNEDHFLSLALHARRFGNIFSLKRAVDAACLVGSRPSFDWNYVERMAASQRCKSAVLFLLFHAQMISPGSFCESVIRRFAVSARRCSQLNAFVNEKTMSSDNGKDAFLGATLLLYDSLIDLFNRFSTMPLEQFAKYYELKPYAIKTRILFFLRFFYFFTRKLTRVFFA